MIIEKGTSFILGVIVAGVTISNLMDRRKSKISVFETPVVNKYYYVFRRN